MYAELAGRAGDELDLSAIARDRPAYLILSDEGGADLEACMRAGVLCGPEAVQEAWTATLLLPTEDPGALERALGEALAEQAHAMRALGEGQARYVQLDVPLGTREIVEATALELAPRRELTPALAAALVADGASAIWAPADFTRRFGSYVSAVELTGAVGSATPEMRARWSRAGYTCGTSCA